MALTDLTLVSTLKTKLHWHQARQRVLAENVANADTPGFRPRELVAPAAPGAAPAALAMARTSPLHLVSASGEGAVATAAAARFETRPSGNAVDLEDEMLKASANQSEYQLAASLYQKSLSLLRAAAGVKGA